MANLFTALQIYVRVCHVDQLSDMADPNVFSLHVYQHLRQWQTLLTMPHGLFPCPASLSGTKQNIPIKRFNPVTRYCNLENHNMG